MPLLPSGLSELVGDEESLARFLCSSSYFSSNGVKPGAFLPTVQDRATSVFRVARIGDEHAQVAQLRLLAIEFVESETRSTKGAALLRASEARAAGLQVDADEPPPRHALLRGWPWANNDSELRKAQQKEIGLQLAAAAQLSRW
jgi:hypothetical protein